MESYLEWAGCALGLIGSILLASNTRYSRYGWFAFFFANIAMVGSTRRQEGALLGVIGARRSTLTTTTILEGSIYAVTGILFGVLPARQAARLDPVQSLAKR